MNRPGGFGQFFGGGSPRWLSFTPWILLIAVTAGIYAPSLAGPFVYDDKMFVVLNPAIRQLGLWPSYFTDFQTLSARGMAELAYRPLMTLSFAVDHLLWGLNPFGYHLTNLLWHGVNVYLVYGIFLALGLEKRLSLLGAALFALHPVHTETVSWISRRGDPLFLAATLAAFRAFIAARDADGPWRPCYYGLSLAAFLAGLLSKEMAATLPLLLAAWALLGRSRKDLAATLPFFLVLGVYFIVRTAVLGSVAQTGYWGGSFTATMLTMTPGVAAYLKLMVYPATLSLEYSAPISLKIMSPEFLLSLLAVALSIFVVVPLRHDRWVVFGVVWFYVTLLPVLNIIPIRAYIAERFLYLPSIGVILVAARAAGWLMERTRSPRSRGILWLGLGVVLCLLAARTHQRNMDWADPLRLWTATARTAPWNAKAHYNLGKILVDKKEFAKAEKAFLRALEIDPRHSQSANNLGNIAFFKNDLPRAIAYWRKSVAADPENAEPLFNLGLAAEKQGRNTDALRYYQRFLKVAPPDLGPWIGNVRKRIEKLSSPRSGR